MIGKGCIRKYLPCLKYGLLVFSMGLVFAAILWPTKPSFIELTSATADNVNGAEKLRYRGESNKGKSYVVHSNKGHEISGKEVLLKELQLQLALDGGGELALKADEGLYNKTEKTIMISGNVRLDHNNGFHLQTTEATINFNDGTAENNAPVEGQKEQTFIRAHGFKVLDQGQRIIFLGKPELTIRESKVQ
ncbi:MAG: LPS export ABC transporter periplasmic protein LptC [Alphaproteobacteria bacterium]|nr:LPS export ABC transporter periplasmic protein LptC [Alphaproteobacteria bacterium]